MPALAPDVAAIRSAVRRALRPHAPQAYTAGRREPDGPPTLVACSGGPDSLALAAAARFIAPRMGLRPGLVTVDHGLQPGSADRAADVAAWARAEGFDPVRVCRVEVAGRTGGPEAAAREARYAALVEAARADGAATVLLGHTRDDQAETVLLALVRGGGARGLASMPVRRVADGVTLLRPLLDVGRSQTEAACAAMGLRPWRDPHNADPAFARTQARELLAELVARLGSGVVANLARTADLAAADAEVIDGLAESALADALDPAGAIGVAALRVQPTAVRRAMLRLWLLRSGVPGAGLGHGHLSTVDGLVTGWRGQRGASLPGGFAAVRREGMLRLTRPDPP